MAWTHLYYILYVVRYKKRNNSEQEKKIIITVNKIIEDLDINGILTSVLSKLKVTLEHDLSPEFE